MNTSPRPGRPGFTLMESVIAIGVLAVLITAFMYAFGPAMSGIRRAINVQEADRMASTLERELGTLRPGQETGGIKTGFDKGYEWIKSSNEPGSAICVYQYRGDPSKQRSDGTLEPVVRSGGRPGSDYIVQPIVRRTNDPLFPKDLEAVSGPVFVVKCTQLVYDQGGLVAGSAGQIRNPVDGKGSSSPDDFTEAVIAFSAEFFGMPANNVDFFQGQGFQRRFRDLRQPVFTRNLAVRR